LRHLAIIVIMLMAGTLVSGVGCAQNWSDNFERPDATFPTWDNADGITVTADGVTGAADGRRYGSLWRKTPGGKSVEATARMKVSNKGDWTGAFIGFASAAHPDAGNPKSPAYSPNVHMPGIWLSLGPVVPKEADQKPYALMHLRYDNPYCGYGLPYRLGRLKLDTWYDVKLQSWLSDGEWLGAAWYKPSGTRTWQPLQDNWPGNRHVVAYEGFEPNHFALLASQNVLVDNVAVKSIKPPAVPRLSEPRLVNGHPFTLISLSWSTPDTKFLHDNVAEMEKVPLDGWTTYAANPRLPMGRALYGYGTGDLSWDVFQNKRATRAQIDPAIADLKSTKFNRFRSNYISIISYLTDGVKAIDWFDDAWWETISENARLQAVLAKEGGCEGILFDPEMYGCAFWGWPELSKHAIYKDKTYKQVQAKVRQRGREFARALNSAYPGVPILSIHGYDTALRYEDPRATKAQLDKGWYGLLPAFLDGILEGSDDKTLLIDGCEATYWVNSFPDFVERVQTFKTECIKLSEVPNLFKKKTRVGFALYLDRDWRGQPWDSADPTKNHWTPERFALVVGNALAAGDGFVWIYSETATWHLNKADQTIAPYVKEVGWHGTATKWVPVGYRDALDKGRLRAAELRRKYGSASR
jgi:hypothetical protein